MVKIACGRNNSDQKSMLTKMALSEIAWNDNFLFYEKSKVKEKFNVASELTKFVEKRNCMLPTSLIRRILT